MHSIIELLPYSRWTTHPHSLSDAASTREGRSRVGRETIARTRIYVSGTLLLVSVQQYCCTTYVVQYTHSRSSLPGAKYQVPGTSYQVPGMFFHRRHTYQVYSVGEVFSSLFPHPHSSGEGDSIPPQYMGLSTEMCPSLTKATFSAGFYLAPCNDNSTRRGRQHMRLRNSSECPTVLGSLSFSERRQPRKPCTMYVPGT